MRDHLITFKTNMQKSDTAKVRQFMSDEGIVPLHLHVNWLHLTIYTQNGYNSGSRWVLCAERTAHGTALPSVLVSAEEMAQIAQTIMLAPHLPSETFMDMVKMLKPQVLSLRDTNWRDYVKEKYPKYFK